VSYSVADDRGVGAGSFPWVDIADSTKATQLAETSSISTKEEHWHLVPIGIARSLTQRHPLRALPCLIGRGENLSLFLPSPHVSKLHAIIFEQEGQLFVRDNGSTNGTYVNGGIVIGQRALQDGDLVQFADAPFRVTRETVTVSQTVGSEACDMALAVSQFDRLLHDDGVIVPHFQPIVSATDLSVVAYELLGRSRLFGLTKPNTMFCTAAQLGMEAELSRCLRYTGYRAGIRSIEPIVLFLNTHPRELDDVKSLVRSLRELREVSTEQAITIEIHESAAADAKSMQVLRYALRDMNMKLAYDDFGAGQSRLSELASVQPDYLKFDMTLIREIHKSTKKKLEMLGTLVRMTNELGVTSLAEGVECEEEANVCRQLGFELFQGFHFGRPKKASEYFKVERRSASSPENAEAPPVME
jgi:EAL domain-containing protein (putative c-di-GMP-specific phosphodiesterase class I)